MKMQKKTSKSQNMGEGSEKNGVYFKNMFGPI